MCFRTVLFLTLHHGHRWFGLFGAASFTSCCLTSKCWPLDFCWTSIYTIDFCFIALCKALWNAAVLKLVWIWRYPAFDTAPVCICIKVYRVVSHMGLFILSFLFFLKKETHQRNTGSFDPLWLTTKNRMLRQTCAVGSSFNQFKQKKQKNQWLCAQLTSYIKCCRGNHKILLLTLMRTCSCISSQSETGWTVCNCAAVTQVVDDTNCTTVRCSESSSCPLLMWSELRPTHQHAAISLPFRARAH